MNKNVKKILSYLLGTVLALGLGLTYAYAVGANDSNTFVTKAEWQERVDKLDADLDNITRTINDTTLDYMMNRSRIQVSMFEGWQTSGNRNIYTGRMSANSFASNITESLLTRFPTYNKVYLLDQFNGTQAFSAVHYPASNQSYSMYSLRERFALKTNVDNIYVVVSVYANAAVIYHYVIVGTYPISTSTSNIPARNLTITLPRSEWKYYDSSVSSPGAISRNNSGVYVAHNVSMLRDYILYSTASGLNGFGSTTGYRTKSVDANNITYTLEFPAGTNSMSDIGNSSYAWDLIYMNMADKKFATAADRLITDLTGTWGTSIGKVYSPQKGCLSLKSFVNGEIPILNE